ncbi:zinc/iron permease [Granulicella tundricola MP5ACTX9]|uniref:Zinc/iron permease n=2 Tax=Granulicella TaxID=940557 RepID=E8WZD0_GRATM|nr:zinc/iron permease [Granulicella tundricola MP5ACTX9]
MPLLIAAAAGLLLGAAFLDLLPEALDLGAKQRLGGADVLGLTLGFFLLFAAIESGLDALTEREAGAQKTLRRVAGGLLVFHSFRDGMAIGAAFAASHTAGYAVALGIGAHDLADGMNTIILTTRGEKARWPDYLFLGLDAMAPFVGGLLTVWWLISSRDAVILLTLAAGFFLQMATSDFLPQVRRHEGNRRWLLGAVVGGAGVIYLTNRLLAG